MNQPKQVVLETSMGDITVELYWNHAPKTCKNFAELARSGYYNNCIFHRIIKDFMIQGGDPTGTGRGGSSIYGPTFEDEFHPDLKHTGAGILSMANRTNPYLKDIWRPVIVQSRRVPLGPNTNGSQFFITLSPTQWLDGKHTVFGRVCAGIAIVSKIAMVNTNSSDRPTDDIAILQAYTQD